MDQLIHTLLLITSFCPTLLAGISDELKDVDHENEADKIAKLKLNIPKYSEWIYGEDQADYKRGEDTITYEFTQEEIEEKKKYSFVWTTLEQVDVPKTTLSTPYWNMSCEVAAGQAYEGGASFTLSEKKPWIKIDGAKSWAGVSCSEAKCLAEACKDEDTPMIDTFLP
ncbi:hypothetical protein L486_05033 [Kwoniella mangroviensis CBS 10435]|uniref:Uncharacterized protein n=1 Tax=Kwoniella mangroviensis CBS 10435 TaxID=1331196 RepID=A0A1B9IQ92_9TREE|nr:hypothetical protein L486_05033 [Kwoniella mangroviensis CBS 10435]OCF75877.1 hypothetical protein I204_03173 [Kwoniella mangroviensis CBS 8886]